jgi:hypothetical protein
LYGEVAEEDQKYAEARLVSHDRGGRCLNWLLSVRLREWLEPGKNLLAPLVIYAFGSSKAKSNVPQKLKQTEDSLACLYPARSGSTCGSAKVIAISSYEA